MKKVFAVIITLSLVLALVPGAMAKTIIDPEKVQFVALVNDAENGQIYTGTYTAKSAVRFWNNGQLLDLYVVTGSGLHAAAVKIDAENVITIVDNVTGETVYSK